MKGREDVYELIKLVVSIYICQEFNIFPL